MISVALFLEEGGGEKKKRHERRGNEMKSGKCDGVWKCKRYKKNGRGSVTAETDVDEGDVLEERPRVQLTADCCGVQIAPQVDQEEEEELSWKTGDREEP